MDENTFLNWVRQIQSDKMALLIRHSIRQDPIPQGIHHQKIHLTREGQRAAFNFGVNLPEVEVVKLYYSPIHRCRETAEHIQEGVQSRKGVTVMMGERLFLGTNYIIDLNKMVHLIKTQGRFVFARNWINGNLHHDVIDDPYQLASAIVHGVSASLTDIAKNAIAVFVTHDLNILAVKDLYLQVRHEVVGWPLYLDGIIFMQNDNNLSLRWRDHLFVLSPQSFSA